MARFTFTITDEGDDNKPGLIIIDGSWSNGDISSCGPSPAILISAAIFAQVKHIDKLLDGGKDSWQEMLAKGRPRDVH